MRISKGLARRVFESAIVSAAVLMVLAAASCGNGKASETDAATSSKLPPAMVGSEEASSLSSSAGEATPGDGAATSPESAASTQSSSSTTAYASKTVTLSGVEFNVLAAKRQSNNKLVTSAGQRQVEGDFLEVELSIRNSSDSLVDLSRFSFRLWNPYIQASAYDDYYGSTTAYGGYVSTNIISAALLDYSTLQQVSCTLRIGEELGDVFLFFDLNPLSVLKNEGFTKEGSNLILYDTETGHKVEVNLAGLQD